MSTNKEGESSSARSAVLRLMVMCTVMEGVDRSGSKLGRHHGTSATEGGVDGDHLESRLDSDLSSNSAFKF